MKTSLFKQLKPGDWVLIESLCYGLSKTKEGTLCGDTGPWLSQVKAVGLNFIEYVHYMVKEPTQSSCGVGHATRRQVIAKVHSRDLAVLK